MDEPQDWGACRLFHNLAYRHGGGEVYLPSTVCTPGIGRAIWKTPALEATTAVELFKLHDKNIHSKQVTGAAEGAG